MHYALTAKSHKQENLWDDIDAASDGPYTTYYILYTIHYIIYTAIYHILYTGDPRRRRPESKNAALARNSNETCFLCPLITNNTRPTANERQTSAHNSARSANPVPQLVRFAAGAFW